MLVALHFCRKDYQQAVRLADWLVEIGPFNHDILIARDHRAEPIPAFEKAFRSATEIVIRDDVADKWCESANHAFKRIGKHVQHSLGAQAFLYIEPDVAILRASAFDEIEAEYRQAIAAGKLFLGQLIDQRDIGVDSPPHCSGVAVYPANLVEHAGIIYQAENIPFDIVAGPQIVPRLAQSELLLHLWKAPPFATWADVERRIFAVRPKCTVYHSDKSGSLIGLLRERKNQAGSTPATAGESSVVAHGSASREFESPISSTLPDGRMMDLDAGKMADDGPMAAIEATLPIKTEHPLTLSESNETSLPIILYPPQTPWASKPDSIAEIRRLAARLMQFSDSSPHVRLVRAELHDAGVIQLAYRYKKRGGWKRKKGKT